jgi:RsiW-degrading membrane proteinase PrsW (M82 family)
MSGVPTALAPPRLGRQPAFWIFVMLLIGCSAFFSVEQLGYVSSAPGAWLLSIVLLAVTAVPAGVIIYRLDQFEPEPASLIGVALLWGGVVAVTFGGITNSAALSFLQHVVSGRTVDAWGAAIVAPIDEELYKGAGLVMLYLMARHELDGVMDGLVYGAMIGLGFQVIEDIQYFMLAAAQSGSGQGGAVISSFFLRVVVSGLYSHMLFTGLMGFGFAYYVTEESRSFGRRLGVFGLFGVLAWAAHFVWDSPWLDSLMSGGNASFVFALVIKGLPFLALLVMMTIFARRRERRAFDRLMAVEVGSDVVTSEEYRILRSGRLRRRTLRSVKRTKGPMARAVVKRLMREQMNLALFHSRTASAEHPAIDVQRQYILQLKQRLAAVGRP